MPNQGRSPAGVVVDAPAWFRAALADEPQTGYVRVDGADIAWRAWGDPGADGIVLIHGGAAHARWWDHIAPLLVEDRRRVVAVDLSGHGDSDHRDHYDLDRWVAEAVAVAAGSAGIRDGATVVGHSLGGLVALRAGMLHPAHLGEVVVIDTPLGEPSPEERAARAGQAFGPLRVYPSRDQALTRFRPMPGQPVIDFVAGHVAAHSLREVPGGWSWKFDPGVLGFASPRTWPAMPARTRVVLIRGERGILPRRISPAIRDLLGGTATMIEIPDADHHVMLDQPLALVAALRTDLASRSRLDLTPTPPTPPPAHRRGRRT
ncbi:alpha/beta hydrolase [Nonomuraea mesophila]|uniref:Alpha/beta hydrolase n=1 Tax=Nonomuraea mesophila TaxID=2530382 RepID=A0A4R5F9B3_9ACTN|nr:alpha/beta hydrolase [Nonomuraea mesophila]TDE45163.1 alpha/beta hydrolase [Nonomuraea mesophila]